MALLLKTLVLVCSFVFAAATGPRHYEQSKFVLGKPESIVKTDAGEVLSVLGPQHENPLVQHNVRFVVIKMEPKAISLPHYMDSQLLFVVQEGEATLSFSRGTKLVSKQLKVGDVYSLPAGIVYHVLNTHESEQLKLLIAIDTASSVEKGHHELFFVAGGVKPPVVLSGFSTDVLSASFRVDADEITRFLSSQKQGPIVRTSVESFDELVSKSKKDKKHKGKDDKEEKHKDDEEKKHEDKEDEDEEQQEDEDQAFNLKEKHDFENEHGWIASTFNHTKLLHGTRFQIFVAHLNPDCLVAPRWNSLGHEFGVVTRGSGRIQISYPNGTNAADEELEAGNLFYIPRFLASSQMSSSFGMEFIAFVAEEAAPRVYAAPGLQFLAGGTSVLKSLNLQTLAVSFNVPEQLLESLLSAQAETMILPRFGKRRGFEKV